MTALPSFTVKNEYGSEVRAQALDFGEKIVALSASAGPLRFQFNATPAQARELADALNACADALEAEVMEVAP